jgi:hypothetical protein
MNPTCFTNCNTRFRYVYPIIKFKQMDAAIYTLLDTHLPQLLRVYTQLINLALPLDIHTHMQNSRDKDQFVHP